MGVRLIGNCDGAVACRGAGILDASETARCLCIEATAVARRLVALPAGASR